MTCSVVTFQWNMFLTNVESKPSANAITSRLLHIALMLHGDLLPEFLLLKSQPRFGERPAIGTDYHCTIPILPWSGWICLVTSEAAEWLTLWYITAKLVYHALIFTEGPRCDNCTFACKADCELTPLYLKIFQFSGWGKVEPGADRLVEIEENSRWTREFYLCRFEFSEAFSLKTASAKCGTIHSQV